MRILIKLAFFLVVVLALNIFCLPFFASTTFGKNLLLSIGKKETKRLKIEHLSLNWLKPQEIKGLSYIDENNYVVSIDQISIKDSLLKFISNGFNFSSIEISSPKLNILSIQKKIHKAPKESLSFLAIRELKVLDGRINIQNNGLKPIAFKDIEINMKTPKGRNHFSLDIFAKSYFGTSSGILDLSLDSSFDLKNLLETLRYSGHANIQSLPLSGIDQCIAIAYPQYLNILKNSIGDTLNVRAKFSGSPYQYDISIDAESEKLNASISTKDMNIYGSIKTTLTPAIANLIFPSAPLLEKPTETFITINQLKIPSKNKQLSFKNTQFSIQTSFDQVILKEASLDKIGVRAKTNDLEKELLFESDFSLKSANISTDVSLDGQCATPLQPTNIKVYANADKTFLEDLQLSSVQLFVEGANTSSLKFQGKTTAYPQSEYLQKLLGKTLQINVRSDLTYSEKQKIVLTNAQLVANSELINATTDFEFYAFPVLVEIVKPVSIVYHISPDNFSIVSPSFSKQISLVDPLEFYLSIQPFKATISQSKTIGISNISAKATANEAIFIENYSDQKLMLKNLKALVQYDHKNNEFDIVFGSQFPYQKEIGEIDATISLKNFDLLEKNRFQKATSSTHLQAKQLPSVLLGPWINDSVNFSHVIGNSFSCNAKLLRSASSNEFDLNFHSKYLTLFGSFDLGSGIVLKKPLKVNWTLTPKGFKSIYSISKSQVHPIYFSLKSNGQINLTIEKFHYQFEENSNQLEKLSLKAGVSSSNLLFEDEENYGKTNVNDLNITFSKKPHNPFNYELKTNVTSSRHDANSSESGFIQGYGQFNLENSNNTLQVLDWKSSLQLKHFPVDLLDIITELSYDRPLLPSWILGKYLYGSLDAEIKNNNGYFKLNSTSPSSKLSINSVIINNKLMLKDPIYATFQWTPELDKFLFNRSSVFAVQAMQPITLTVDQRGFIIPLKNYSYKSVQAPIILLNLGKISFYNRGNVSNLSSIFKLDNDNKLNFWFAPFRMSYSRGNLDIKRTEFLFENRYHLCLWGGINFIKDYVDLTLGLTSQSLSRGLGIQGLPSSYVLQVPLQGSFDNVQLNKTAALARIALLLARSQSHQFGEYGGIVNLFGDLLDDQSSVPPPVKPYPWGEISSHFKPYHQYGKKQKHRKQDKEIFNYSLPLETFSINPSS